MMQIIEQTDEEKMAMYMKHPKKKLAEMLIQCNKILDSTLRQSANPTYCTTTIGGWQICPKCNGQGTVQKPPHIPGDVDQWTSDATQYKCNVCDGEKIISTVSGKPVGAR